MFAPRYRYLFLTGEKKLKNFGFISGIIGKELEG